MAEVEDVGVAEVGEEDVASFVEYNFTDIVITQFMQYISILSTFTFYLNIFM